MHRSDLGIISYATIAFVGVSEGDSEGGGDK